MFDAIVADDVDEIDKLLQNGFDINLLCKEFGLNWIGNVYGINYEQYDHLENQPKYGEYITGTPLHLACFLNKEKAVMLLLAKGCDETIKNSAEETARDVAGHKG